MSNPTFWGNFDNIFDAAAYYYGQDGSTFWRSISDSAQSAGKKLTNKDYFNVLERSPNVGVTYNQNGKILGFFEKPRSSWTQVSPNLNIKDITKGNSNALVPVNSTARFQYPATYTPPSGNVGGNVTKGLKTSGKAAFAGKISGVVGAVSVGTSLGKEITQALYDLNPDFWESIGMPEMDASKWKAISTGNDIFDGIFNTLFGLDENSGEAQAYIDENVYAYLGKALLDAGVFDPVEVYDEAESFIPSVTGLTIEGDFNFPFSVFKPPVSYITPSPQQGFDEFLYIYQQFQNYPLPYMLKVKNSKEQYERLIFFSENPNWRVSSEVYGYKDDVMMGSSVAVYNYTKTVTVNGRTFYFYDAGAYDGYDLIPIHTNHFTSPDSMVVSTYNAISLYPDIIKIMFFNDGMEQVETGGVPGISNQPGATVPTFPDSSSEWSVDDFLDWLRQNMPQLWDDALEYDVPDDDSPTGATGYTYIPIPFPWFLPNPNPSPDTDDETDDISKPYTGDSTQTNPQVDPETAPETLVTYIIKIITGQDTTPSEPDPDIGEGSTPIAPLPLGSVSALFSIYNPTVSQLNSFGSWLWTSNIFVQIAQLFNDPMQSIIGLHKIFITPTTPTTSTIHVGYLDSEVPSKVVSEQYNTIDCGTVDCFEFFGNVFDYSPYTTVSLYLPFIGIVPLDISDIMRSQINIKYHVDVLTGATLAEVRIIRDLNNAVLYTYSGNCSVEYPISHGSYLSIISSIIGVGVSAGLTAVNPAVGGAFLASSVSQLTHSRATVERSGSFTGNSGAMGIKKPYLIITRPQIAMPKNHQVFQGYPSSSSVLVKNCTGFIRVKSVQMEAFIATADEKLEIEKLLKEGILVD